jgi:hypothetical protein
MAADNGHDPDGTQRTTLEPFMNVMLGLPMAFGVERVMGQDDQGKAVPAVALRIEHSTGSQIFPFPLEMATAMAHQLLREATGLHVAGG